MIVSSTAGTRSGVRIMEMKMRMKKVDICMYNARDQQAFIEDRVILYRPITCDMRHCCAVACSVTLVRSVVISDCSIYDTLFYGLCGSVMILLSFILNIQCWSLMCQVVLSRCAALAAEATPKATAAAITALLTSQPSQMSANGKNAYTATAKRRMVKRRASVRKALLESIAAW